MTSSPPKPWEQNGSNPTTMPSITPSITNPSAEVPQVPERSTQHSSYGNTGYGNSMNNYGHNMGNYGSMGNYQSGYTGNYGGNYNAGYNGYGNSYNQNTGYGNSYSGMNRMGVGGLAGGMYNRRMEGDQAFSQQSFTQQMEQSTQSSFQMLDQIVQAFSGFSQMLESTFFATHSSFMAMMGVAEQFGHLRSYIGQIFSIVSILKLLKETGYKIVGRGIPIDSAAINSDAFQEFSKPKPSKKPLIIFLSLIVGLPWLISKLLKLIENRRPSPQMAAIKSIEFCKSMYEFSGEHNGELSFKKGDLVAILEKIDTNWWRGRTQNGQIGLFPQSYVQLIPKSNVISAIDSNNKGSLPTKNKEDTVTKIDQ